MTLAMQCLAVAAAAAILISCVLRINLLRSGEHRVSVFVMYLLWAAFALGVLLELMRGEPLDWYEAACLAGLLLHLRTTRKDWRGCAPRATRVRGFHG